MTTDDNRRQPTTNVSAGQWQLRSCDQRLRGRSDRNGVAAEWTDREAARLLVDAATLAEIGA
jgi:hypothetical protein